MLIRRCRLFFVTSKSQLIILKPQFDGVLFSLKRTSTITKIIDLQIIDINNQKYFGKKLKVKQMKNTINQDERMAKMTFASVYPYYLAKVVKKERTKEELHQVIEWLTGYGEQKLQELIAENVSFEKFFQGAKINPGASLITGLICGYRVEEIENPLTRQIRYLDKLVDELAKGRKMEKILRIS